MKDKAIVLLSGGVDSTTCLALARDEGYEVIALNILYGQRHKVERDHARKIAEFYGCEYIELDLNNLYKSMECPLLEISEKEIPQGNYKKGIAETYVPFRNGVLLSMAVAVAYEKDASIVFYGAHRDDVAGNAYPDCSEAFVENMSRASFEGTGGKVNITAPFINTNKSGVVKKGLELGVPYDLTYSCYEGGEKPCGECATCLDRKKAFEENGVKENG